MSNFGTLLRLIILNALAGLRPSSFKREDGKWDISFIAQAVAAVLALCLIPGLIIFIEVLLYRGLSLLRHPELLPALALMVAMVGTLLMSFFSILSGLYFSRDAVWMSYLPVRSSTVMAAKLTESWAGETIFNLLIIMPAFVMYGIHLHADALYYLRAVVIALFSSMLPIAIITVLSALLARVVGKLRNSAALTTVLTLLMVLGILGAEMTILPSIPEDADAMWILKLLVSREALLQTLTSSFPPVLWGIHALMGNWAEFALFILCSAGSMALCVLLLGKPYLNMCVRLSEQTTVRKAARVTDGSLRSSSPLLAMLRLELADLTRSSVYLTQCGAGAVVYPLVIGVMLAAGSVSEEMALFKAEIAALLSQIPATDVMLAVCAVLLFALFVSPAAPTSVSREGARHAILRAMPIHPRTALRAKLLCAAVIDVISAALMTAVLVVGLQLPPVIVLGSLALTAVGRYAALTVMLAMDCLHPLLNWKTETQAVKQNLNVLFAMLICLVMLALPIAVCVLMALRGGSAAVRLAVTTAILLLEAACGGAFLHTLGEKRYAALEG